MKIPPLAQLAICSLIAGILSTLLPLMAFSAQNWLVAIIALVGSLFLLPAVISFATQKTTVNPQTPSAATTLVTGGIYSITRNPMYLGMLLLLVAFAVWLGEVSAFLPVFIFFLSIDRIQIRREEESLRRIFGQAFEDYANHVPKWLFI